MKANLGNLIVGYVCDLIDNQLVTKAVTVSLSVLMQIIYASVGLWMLLAWVGYAEGKRKKSLSQWIIRFGNLCMGVYLLQQFILKGLYNHTALPEILGCYWLPWVGFAITMLASLFLTKVSLRSQFGRSLIG